MSVNKRDVMKKAERIILLSAQWDGSLADHCVQCEKARLKLGIVEDACITIRWPSQGPAASRKNLQEFYEKTPEYETMHISFVRLAVRGSSSCNLREFRTPLIAA